ncbi:MAG: hypothetical protein V2I63_01475 [Pseudomonadales bacterium]|jgi:hypothetical protein|nr:hypothetical protein [Pseudomonadales bacterium]
MELDIRRDADLGCVQPAVRGRLDARPLDRLRQVMVEEAANSACATQLVDFVAADGTALPIEAIRRFGRELAEAPAGAVKRRAVVVSNALAYGMARVVGGITGASEHTLRVFSTVEDAVAWLEEQA